MPRLPIVASNPKRPAEATYDATTNSWAISIHRAPRSIARTDIILHPDGTATQVTYDTDGIPISSVKMTEI